jgi:hypothetical protein
MSFGMIARYEPQSEKKLPTWLAFWLKLTVAAELLDNLRGS